MPYYSLNWIGGPELYIGVTNAARPPKGGPAEAEGLPVSSLPWMDNSPSDTKPGSGQSQQQINTVCLIDRTLSGATTPVKVDLREIALKGSLHIPQIPKAGDSISVGLM